MKLTPLDLRKQQFGKAFRGYDPDEVRSFLDLVARQWEEVHDEVRLADERVAAMEHKLKHYERVEMALQEALEAARESAKRAEAAADQRAKLIVEEAELKAMRVVSDAEQERYHLRQDFVKLTHRQNEVAARLRGFLMSELEILAQFQGDDPVGFIKLVPAGRAGELPPGPQRALGEGPAATSEAAEAAAPGAYDEVVPAAPAPAEPAPVAHSVGEANLPEPEAAAPAAEAPIPLAEEPVTSPFESILDAPIAPAEEHAPEAPQPEPEPAPIPAEEAPAAIENGAPPQAPPPADRPLHQILLDRLRGSSPNPEPSVWERYTAVPDEAADGGGGDTAPASSGDAAPAPTSDAAHGWSLRSLVTGEAEPDAPAQVPADEREKIRRLLEDLD